MNKQRRATLAKIAAILDTARAQIEQARDDVDTERSDEQDTFDNMPESLQGGERGQKCEAAADTLQTAYDELDNAVSSLESAVASIIAASE